MDSDSHPHIPELEAITTTTSDDGDNCSSLDDQNVVVGDGESRDANDTVVEGANRLSYFVLIWHNLQSLDQSSLSNGFRRTKTLVIRLEQENGDTE
ncbi:hypothetical protein L2E82_31875 [Cichorium intybus]|uniref:Uncharacterized protein n=1 Tax=Cichorium intybus TaxID=13427 RepID=A0ACB9BEF3_CICIN|nr:hypothetical protein L2E82_31875 [Cichorium intybus]